MKTRTTILAQIAADLEAELQSMDKALENRVFGFHISDVARKVVNEALLVADDEKSIAAQRKRHKKAFSEMDETELEFVLDEFETALPGAGGKVYYGINSSIDKVVRMLASVNDFYALRFVCEQLRDKFSKAFFADHPRQVELDYNIFFATQRLPSKDNSGDKIYVDTPDGTDRLRDEHGHWVVQHDLFNHDGLTQDGIAEAFEEFAAKEKLSFF